MRAHPKGCFELYRYVILFYSPVLVYVFSAEVQDSRHRGGVSVRGHYCCIKNEFSARSITKSEHHEKKSQRRRKTDCHPFPADILSSTRPFLRTSHILGGCIIESVHRGVSTAFMKNCGRKEGLDT